MWSILRRVLLVAIVLVAVAAIGWYLYGSHHRRIYEERVEALRAAGQPTRFEDLAAPPVPDEENGAKLLEEAHRILEEREKAPDSAEDLLWKSEHTDDERLRIAEYLESLAPYFDLLARVPERPGWWLDLAWSAGIEMRVDLYTHLNEARTYLVGRVEADRDEAGRTERAAETALLLLALGAKCRGPCLLGYLVAEMTASDSVEVLRTSIRQPGFDAALFRRVVDPPLARSIPDRGPPRFVFVQERAFGIGAVEAIAAGAPYYLSLIEKRTISRWEVPSLYREAASHLDVLEKAIARCDTTPEDAIQVARELSSESAPSGPILGDTGTIYSRTFTVFADFVASRRLARVVMALLEHRQREGSWPHSLAILGDLPADPFSGKPFLYERAERGCTVRAAKEAPFDELEERNLAWTLEDDQIPAMAR